MKMITSPYPVRSSEEERNVNTLILVHRKHLLDQWIARLTNVVRKDGHHPIIFMNCGPLRYKVDDRKQAEFRPFEHKAIVRRTDFRLPDDLCGLMYPAMHELYSALICDDRRNNMIVEDVLKAVKENRFPILLTERRQHLEMLADILSPILQNVFILHGGLGHKHKQKQSVSEIIKAASENEEKVIIATGRYLGEGFIVFMNWKKR